MRIEVVLKCKPSCKQHDLSFHFVTNQKVIFPEATRNQCEQSPIPGGHKNLESQVKSIKNT